MIRERAIVLLPQPAWPLDDGGRIGLWQITWSIARAFETTIVMMTRPGRDHAAVPEALLALGARVIAVPHTPRPTALAALEGLAGPWPYTVARYQNPRYYHAVAQAVQRFRPRLAVVNHLHMASYADALGEIPFVLREHNVESLWLERYARTLRGPGRWYALDQAARMRRVEGNLCARASLVLAIHPGEAAAIRGLAPTARVEVIPVAVDFDRFPAPAPASPPVVLVTGSFLWSPNETGARRFIREGWPELRHRIPGVRLRLAGKGMNPALVRQARAAGAEPVGYVQDMSAEFAAASVLVVPLWSGAGMRVKIVEAAAARLPVVATPMAAEGIGMVSGAQFQSRETARELGIAAAELLLDPGCSRAIAKSAHDFAREHFALESVSQATVRLCRSVLPPAARLSGVAPGVDPHLVGH